MCKCQKNGETFLKQILPVPDSSPSSSVETYYLSLVHFLCGNRKICVNASYPLTGDMHYKIQDVSFLGQNTYGVTVLAYGEVHYVPYIPNNGQCCSPCPKVDYIFEQFTIPVYNRQGAPNVNICNESSVVDVSPANVKDCCSVTNAVQIDTVFSVSVSNGSKSLGGNTPQSLNKTK